MSIASFYLNTDTYQVRFASAEAGRLTVSLGLAEEKQSKSEAGPDQQQ